MDYADPSFDGENLTEPNNIEAERYALAGMINGGGIAIEAAAEQVVPEDFYRPAHQEIFLALVSMYAAQEPITAVTLWNWMCVNGNQKVLGDAAAVYLADLIGLPVGGIAAVAAHCKIVADRARRRMMLVDASQLRNLAYSMSDDPDEQYAALEQELVMLRDRGRSARSGRNLVKVGAFLDDAQAGTESVIPGLLDHQDRVIVVAGEGAGKTTLAHQIGFCAAVGVHPFQWDFRYEPQKVMIIDLENPTALLQRRFRKLANTAERYGWDSSNITLYLEPAGICLPDGKTMFTLAERIGRVEPDLIIAGPIYKMLTGVNSDKILSAHSRVASFFDRMRQRHGCAVWLEAHAPFANGDGKREMRPEGSNLWSKWPEFGLSLYKATKQHGGQSGALEISRFRGHREENRSWPGWITRSAPGDWPWTGEYDRSVFQGTLPATRYEGEGDA